MVSTRSHSQITNSTLQAGDADLQHAEVSSKPKSGRRAANTTRPTSRRTYQLKAIAEEKQATPDPTHTVEQKTKTAAKTRTTTKKQTNEDAGPQDMVSLLAKGFLEALEDVSGSDSEELDKGPGSENRQAGGGKNKAVPNIIKWKPDVTLPGLEDEELDTSIQQKQQQRQVEDIDDEHQRAEKPRAAISRVPPPDKRLQQRESKGKAPETAGKEWYNLPATQITDEVKNDLRLIRLRSALDPKTFYKKFDNTKFPKYFQMGTVVEGASEFYSSRLARKERKQTFTEEIMTDPQLAQAKWGEGDARWKVQDLGYSGKNVNQWHWEEKNAIPWCKDKLKELFADTPLGNAPDALVKTTDKISVTGDALICQRKGKIIPTYELAIEIGWEATKPDGSKAGSGQIKFPYVSEENADEDPELQITATDGPQADAMKQLIHTSSKSELLKLIASFVADLQQGGPMAKGADPSTVPDAGQSTAANGGTGDKTDGQQPSQPTRTYSLVSGKRTIELTEQFFAGSKEIYDCFTDAHRMQGFTMSPASADPVPGGKYSMFGGSIEGTYVTLEPTKKIELDWRFSNWEDGCFSRVVLEFEEQEKGNTLLRLTQTGIPDTDRFGNHDIEPMTRAGWKDQVLQRIKKVFGY